MKRINVHLDEKTEMAVKKQANASAFTRQAIIEKTLRSNSDPGKILSLLVTTLPEDLIKKLTATDIKSFFKAFGRALEKEEKS